MADLNDLIGSSNKFLLRCSTLTSSEDLKRLIRLRISPINTEFDFEETSNAPDTGDSVSVLLLTSNRKIVKFLSSDRMFSCHYDNYHNISVEPLYEDSVPLPTEEQEVVQEMLTLNASNRQNPPDMMVFDDLNKHSPMGAMDSEASTQTMQLFIPLNPDQAEFFLRPIVFAELQRGLRAKGSKASLAVISEEIRIMAPTPEDGAQAFEFVRIFFGESTVTVDSAIFETNSGKNFVALYKQDPMLIMTISDNRVEFRGQAKSVASAAEALDQLKKGRENLETAKSQLQLKSNDRFEEKSHQVQGAASSSPHASSDENRVVRVEWKGVLSEEKQETVLLYFESPRSSGGDIESHEFSAGHATLLFCASEAARRVTEKKDHVVLGVAMTATLVTIKPEVILPIDNRRFVLKGIDPNALGSEVLELFIERFASESPSSTIPSTTDPSTVMLVFEKEKDFSQMLALHGKRPTLSNRATSLQQVAHSRTVLIRLGTKRITAETLELYFENKKKSGGGDDALDGPIVQQGEWFVVTFREHEVAQSILAREHAIGGNKLEVKLHYPELDPVTESALPQVNNPTLLRPTVKQANGKQQRAGAAPALEPKRADPSERSSPMERVQRLPLALEYEPGHWSPTNPDGAKIYPRELVYQLRFSPAANEKPKGLDVVDSLFRHLQQTSQVSRVPNRHSERGRHRGRGRQGQDHHDCRKVVYNMCADDQQDGLHDAKDGDTKNIESDSIDSML